MRAVRSGIPGRLARDALPLLGARVCGSAAADRAPSPGPAAPRESRRRAVMTGAFRLAFGAALLSALVALAACGSAPAGIVGLDGAAISAAELAVATPVKIFITTSREASDDASQFFSGERSETVSFAEVTVSIPPNHRIGEIERPKRLPPDPRTEFVVPDPRAHASRHAFAAAIDADLTRKPAGERDVLLFVHGYNTDFTSAVLRTAQFAHDSGFMGTPVLFTWASRGRTLEYVYDLNSALHARDALIKTGKVLRRARGERLDIVAHSMGNLLAVEAIRQLAL